MKTGTTRIGFVALLGSLGLAGAWLLPSPALVPSDMQAPISAATTPATVHGQHGYGKLPLHFEPNRGQADASIQFLARGPGYALLLSDAEQVLRLRSKHNGDMKSDTLKIALAGANSQPVGEGEEAKEGRSHYLNRKPTVTDVPHYGRVRYREVYPGIDLVFYGNPQQLEYDFVVAPGSDPARIRLRFTGSETAEVDKAGDLVLKLAGGEVIQRKPIVYQQIAGGKISVPSAFKLKKNDDAGGPHEVAFILGDYDRTLPLVIDPVLVYSTYFGGSDNDVALGIALDADRNAYITGETFSSNFDASGTLGGEILPLGEGDAFVTKLNPAGDAVVYSAFLGGTLRDFGTAVAVNSAKEAFVVGATESPDFVLSSPQVPDGPLDQNAFVVKLNATGNDLTFFTFLGGSAQDRANDIALDSDGNFYVTGSTASSGFPTTAGAHRTTLGGVDAFVTKFSANGQMAYSTLLGGSGVDVSATITVGPTGEAYVSGSTNSADFPLKMEIEGASGNGDAFVSRLNVTGTDLISSTYLGGQGLDAAYDIALDSGGNIYLAGETSSADFDVTTARIEADSNDNAADGFVAKLSPIGNALTYSTYLGGNGGDSIYGLAVDSSGRAYVAGTTTSTDFNTVNPIESDADGAGSDAFLAKLSAAGDALIYSTYLGGSGGDSGISLALDSTGAAYLAGATASTDFDVVGPIEGAQGGNDVFIAKIAETGGQFRFANPVVAVAESAGTVDSILVERVGDAAGPASVVCRNGAASSQAPGMLESATAGVDFEPVDTTIMWADGDRAAKPCPVTIADDNLAESTETINLGLSNPSPQASLGEPVFTVVNILENDAVVGGNSGGPTNLPPAELSFSAASFSGGEETRTAAVTVNRGGSLAEPVSVFVQTGNGSAAAPGDFVSRSQFLTWQAGDNTPRTVTFEIRDDSLIESNESFAVSLTSVQGNGQLVQPFTAAVNILENDTPQSVSVTEVGRQTRVAVAENVGKFQTVTLLPQPAEFSQSAGRNLDYVTGLDVVAEVRRGSSARLLGKARQPVKLTVRPPDGTANPVFAICVKQFCTQVPAARVSDNPLDPVAKDVTLDEGDPLFDGDENENGMLVARMVVGIPKFEQALTSTGSGGGGGALSLPLLLGCFGLAWRTRRRGAMQKRRTYC